MTPRCSTRFSNALRSAHKAQNEVDKFKNDIRGEIISLGRLLSNKIGKEGANLELESKQVEARIKEFVEQMNVEIEKILSAERSALTDEIQDVLTSPLPEAYFGSVEDRSSSLNGEQVKIIKMNNIQKNLTGLSIIVGRTSEGILKFSNTGVGGFVKATAASGSDLHKGLYSVGKFFGVKFKPWGGGQRRQEFDENHRSDHGRCRSNVRGSGACKRRSEP